MCMGGPSAPPPPPPPPKQPTYGSDAVKGAGTKARQKEMVASMAGSKGTVLTGSSGLADEEATTKKQLLG